MASWFASTTGMDLNSAFDTLTETVQSVTESVQDAIPAEHKAMLAKLTLNTDEMISERNNYREEATRKEDVKDRLNKILPWETLDAEREILVEECKEAILELSGREDTFFGPYEMPLLNVQLQATEEDEEEGTEELVEGTDAKDNGAEDSPISAEEEGDPTVGNESRPQARHRAPSEESREMLAKLEPLPTLLEDFDLEAHVGLIQSVMKEDPNLVDMQANFSGGGARERAFWRNYFFHCAFTRYKAGLSLDEIWSYKDESSNIASHVEHTSTDDAGIASSAVAASNAEEADGSGEHDASPQNVEESAAATGEETVDFSVDAAGNNDPIQTELSDMPFELIDGGVDDVEDPELDELEAEIARELEGL